MYHAPQDCDKTKNKDLYEWMLPNISTCPAIQIP